MATPAQLKFYIKLYKLSPDSTWNDVLAMRDKIAKNTVPCNTNATDFDYSSTLTDEVLIQQMRVAIEREKKRRAVNWDYTPYSSWKPVKELINKKKVDTKILSNDYKFSSIAIQELIDRINALGSFRIDTKEKYYTGNLIKKTDLRDIGRVINQNEMMCLCDCNYCTCDCNYCTCDCNYCTCDCNYSQSLVQGTYFGLKQNYGIAGNKKSGATNVKDNTTKDVGVNTLNATIWSINYCTCDCNYCTCDCNYCTCDCNYCTCDCNYCTCDCNYCTCDCNYCTCDCNYQNQTFEITRTTGLKSHGTKVVNKTTTDKSIVDASRYAYGSRTSTGQVRSYCTCDCNYCTCDCNYCTCDCNYCTCDCNYCTCDCNYCTCDCNQCVAVYYGRCVIWDR